MARGKRSSIPIVVAVSLLCFFHCNEMPSERVRDEIQITRPEETDDGWETGTLASVGMEQSEFERLVKSIDAGIYRDVHSVVVVKNGTLVFEKYWAGHDFGFDSPNHHGTYTHFDRNTRHNTHSATKSIVSALVGIAIDRGLITAKEDVIFKYLPESYAAWRNDGRETITVEHCLMMATGLRWNEWESDLTSNSNDLMRFSGSSDPVNYLLSKSISTEPGTRFYYNSGAVDLLGVLISAEGNQNVQSLSSQRLFGPLGITNYHWSVLSPSGLTCCHGACRMTPRDMAKFGQLFLNGGEWNGTRIISREWVEQSSQYHIDPMVPWADGYGYLWWLRNLEVDKKVVRSFKAIGWGGQEIFVLRDLSMVVVFTGANYVGTAPCDEIMQRYILPAAGI